MTFTTNQGKMYQNLLNQSWMLKKERKTMLKSQPNCQNVVKTIYKEIFLSTKRRDLRM